MPCATTDRVIICCAKWQSLSQCDFCLRFKITTIDKIGQCKVGIFKQMVKLNLNRKASKYESGFDSQ